MPAARPESKVADAHEFGALARRMRGERGLTLAQVAPEVGFSPQHLSKIERGLTGPPSDEAIALFADALDGDIVDFMNAAGRTLNRKLFERRVLDALERLVKEQRDGFERLNQALVKLSKGEGGEP